MLISNQLTGFWAGVELGPPGPPTTLVLQASTVGSASDTITVPAQRQVGDLIVIVDRVLATVAPTLVVPTGFTQIAAFTGAADFNHRLTISAKVSAGTEGSVTGQTGDVDRRKYALLFRPDNPITTLTGFDAAQEGFTNADPPAGTISAAAQVPPLVAVAIYASSSGASLQAATKTFSPAEDGQLPVNTTQNPIYLKYKIYNSSPANISIDLPDVASDNLLAGFGIRVS